MKVFLLDWTSGSNLNHIQVKLLRPLFEITSLFQLYQDQESGKKLHHFLQMVCSMESCTIHTHFPRLPGTLINSTLSRYIAMKCWIYSYIFRHMPSVSSEVVVFSHSVTLPPGVNFWSLNTQQLRKVLNRCLSKLKSHIWSKLDSNVKTFLGLSWALTLIKNANTTPPSGWSHQNVSKNKSVDQ